MAEKQKKRFANSKGTKKQKALRALAWIGAGLLGLFFIFFIALNIFIGWLNTDNGSDWVSAQINGALTDTGYSADIDAFSLSGLTGVAADNLTVKQGDLLILSAQDLGVSLDPLSFAARRIGFNLSADVVRFENMPQPTQAAAEEDDKSFSLPDLFFDVALIDVDIERFILSDAIVKGGLETRIEVEQKLTLSERLIAASGYARVSGEQGFFSSPYYPQRVETALEFAPEQQLLSFKNIEFINDNYEALASGRYSFDDETLELQSKGTWRYPEKLFAEMKEPVLLELFISGPLSDLVGQAEIATRYKGEKINVSGDITYKNDVVSVRDIKGQGGLGFIEGQVDYDVAAARARGGLDYRLDDLAFLDNFIADLGLKGAATGAVTLSQSEAGTQKVAVNTDINGLQWQDFTAASAALKLMLPDINNVQNYEISAQAQKLQTGGVTLDQVSADIAPKDGGYDYNVSLSGYNINPFKARVAGFAQNFSPLDIRFDELALEMGQSRFSGQGEIKGERIDMSLKGEPFNVSELAFVDTSSWPALRFEVFEASLSNTLAQPVLKTNYHIRPRLKKENVTAILQGQTNYEAGQLSANLNGEGTGIRSMDIAFNMPMTLALQPFTFEFDRGAAINGRIDSEADIGAISSLFMDTGYTFDGMLDADATVSGSINAPSINGPLSFSQGRFIDSYNDVQLLDINMRADFNNRRVTIRDFTASDREEKGTLTASGFVDLESFDNPRIDLTAAMQDMHVIKSRNFDAWLEADIAMKGSNGSYLITGEFRPEEINISIPDQFYESIPQLNVVEKEGQKGPMEAFYDGISLDLEFSAENKIFISGRGLDAEAAGKLDITGKLNDPLIEGKLRTIRGRYEEFGRVFTLEKAEIIFRGRMPPSPYLNITAATNVDDITAKVNITDSYENPSIKLSSSPALPEDEVLSLILFGRDINEISPFQALQLADTLRRFSGQGGGQNINPIQKLRQAAGIDELHIEGVGSDNTTVGAGKYLSDKIYVEVEQGSGESAGGAASVEVELTPDITLESKAAQNGESDIGVFWEWDY